jgi:excisionase family DNA binding protein
MMTRTPHKTADLERLLTVQEVADLEVTSTKTIRRRIAAGELRALKAGRQLRIRPQDLRVYRHSKMLVE